MRERADRRLKLAHTALTIYTSRWKSLLMNDSQKAVTNLLRARPSCLPLFSLSLSLLDSALIHNHWQVVHHAESRERAPPTRHSQKKQLFSHTLSPPQPRELITDSFSTD